MRAIGFLIAGFVFVVAAGAVLAQPAEAPKPGPEHAKLGYFVGTWNTEGDMKPNPFGPGGKMTMKDHCEWFEGKFAVVCHAEGQGPSGPAKGIGIMGYSPEAKAYTYFGVSNDGMMMTTIPKGTIDGDTWTYTDESTMGGVTMKSRYVLKLLSPTSYTFKWEMQGEDGKWTTLMDGKATKAG